MKKLVGWVLAGVGVLVGLVVIGFAIVHFYMGHRFGVVHLAPGESPVVSVEGGDAAEGERLARLRGCMGGCHGHETGGGIFFEVPDGSLVVAPDLGRIAATYSVSELETVIRHGIRRDGTSVTGFMPSKMFAGLSDDDTRSIIAFLQTRLPADADLPRTSIAPVLSAMMLYYSTRFGWDMLPAESIDLDRPRLDPASEDPLTRGQYLARTICSECHGDDLRGFAGQGTPSLAISAAYSREDFGILMKTGVPLGGRELGLMKEVAISRFVHFTESETDDLHAFLQTLAAAE